jgi:hypothetical protein
MKRLPLDAEEVVRRFGKHADYGSLLSKKKCRLGPCWQVGMNRKRIELYVLPDGQKSWRRITIHLDQPGDVVTGSSISGSLKLHLVVLGDNPMAV